MVAEVIMPEPNDVYISTVANRDVVFVNGSTYIWVEESDGRRHRRFYAHGDRRQEVFRRRENLRSVNLHRPAHPPQRDDHRHDRHEWKDARRDPHATHVASMSGHHDAPRHRSAAAGVTAVTQQTHRPDAHHQTSRNPAQPLRETSARDGARHHTESGAPAAKS